MSPAVLRSPPGSIGVLLHRPTMRSQGRRLQRVTDGFTPVFRRLFVVRPRCCRSILSAPLPPWPADNAAHQKCGSRSVLLSIAITVNHLQQYTEGHCSVLQYLRHRQLVRSNCVPARWGSLQVMTRVAAIVDL